MRYHKMLLNARSYLFLMLAFTFPATLLLAQNHKTTAFVNVNVIPMDTEKIMENQTVIIKGKTILTMGPAGEVSIPGDCDIIDGKGAYLIPGFADMHVHFDFDPDINFLKLFLAQGVTTVRNLNATTPLHLTWREKANNEEILAPTVYTSGETIVGLSAEYSWLPYASRTAVTLAFVLAGLLLFFLLWLISKFTPWITDFSRTKRLVLPSLSGLLLLGLLTAFSISLTSYARQIFVPSVSIPESPAQARQFIRDQFKLGVDLIKPYNYMPREHYFAAMDEASKLGMYVAGHTTAYPEVVSIEETIAAGQDEVVHADEFTHYFWIGYNPANEGWIEYEIDMNKIDEAAQTIVNGGLALTPTLITNEMTLLGLENRNELLNRSEYKVIRPRVMEEWKNGVRFVHWQGQQKYRRDKWRPFLLKLTKAIYDQGGHINVGTDVSVEGVVPGFSVHQELLLLVEAGLTPFAALKAATHNPAVTAKKMGKEDKWGTVAENNRADLILLSANPLDDIANTQKRVGVMVKGQWFSQQQLDKMVDEFVVSY